MTWYDVEDILYDGSEKDIKSLKCPDCGAKINFHYNATTNSLTICCMGCGYKSVSNGCITVPNCAAVNV